MENQARAEKCRAKLAKHLGVANQMAGESLDSIYEQEIKEGRPDITLIVVKKSTGYGPFFSLGAAARTIPFDHTNAEQRRRYDNELEKVWKYWKEATHR